MNPGDYISLYYLGMCNTKQNNLLSAAKFYKKSIKITKNGLKAKYHILKFYPEVWHFFPRTPDTRRVSY